jgi:hypothetical protein
MTTSKSDFDYRSIKTFDDACRACGTTEEQFNEKFKNLGLDEDTLNYEKLKIEYKAINNGWVPDWNNYDQYKYYPWFEVRPSGSGFSDSIYGFDCTHAYVGSRLCTDTSEKALYMAQQFEQEFKAFLLLSE